ncbi:substrate-binding periplasmic protein [Maridesulfovibrio sp. FT414]|uniref:substrate-binding periplasmic protein n=1 Tax=Maridesulfovibrio sp. FT414 TaxID=2979469 RepID=UPI003D8096F4
MFRTAIFILIFNCLSISLCMADELVFVTLDNTPQAYFEDGKVTGFLADIVTEAARRAGYESTVLIVPWKRALAMVEKGSADAIFNAGYTEQRNKFMRYPNNILITEKIIALRKTGSKSYLGYDLKGADKYVVGVGRGFFYGQRIQDAFDRGIFRRVEEVPNIDLNVKKLLLGRIDFLLADYYPVMKFLSDNRLMDQVEPILSPETGLPVIFSESNTYLAFSRKKKTPAFNSVNKELERMIEDGSYNEIIAKYIPADKVF